VKFKLDENPGKRCGDVLRAAGHDVVTAADESLCAASDPEIIAVCQSEGRALVTLDLDFSNPLVFPPQQYPGIAVLRLPSKPSYEVLLALVQTLVDALTREELAGKLWSVELGRIRIYQPPTE
jgi:predicted nuclease of predicted toxin-antitoxin system